MGKPVYPRNYVAETMTTCDRIEYSSYHRAGSKKNEEDMMLAVQRKYGVRGLSFDWQAPYKVD